MAPRRCCAAWRAGRAVVGRQRPQALSSSTSQVVLGARRHHPAATSRTLRARCRADLHVEPTGDITYAYVTLATPLWWSAWPQRDLAPDQPVWLTFDQTACICSTAPPAVLASA